MAFKPVTWQPVPLLIGFGGGTGSGKTKSAMELASGICGDQRFAVLDTERGRARHYLGRYEFDYDMLEPPFTPERYEEKIREAVNQGYPALVIDSASHMWEGQGGLRDDAANEAERMAESASRNSKYPVSPERYTFQSWNKPKQRLNAFVLLIQQCPIHLIFTFRAKEKLKQVKNAQGKSEIINAGMKPIIDESLPYEMTLMGMFYAEEPGVPSFEYKARAEYLPNVFEQGQPIKAEHGRRLLEWSRTGGQATAKKPAGLILLNEDGQAGTYPTGSAWLAAYRDLMRDPDADRPAIAAANISVLRKLAAKAVEAQPDLEVAEALL